MKNIHFLIKPASSLCNLRCRYCFYADEAQNREQQSMGHMSETTARTLIEEGFRWIEPGGAVSFAFQGGEPTIAGLPFFEAFAAMARRSCPDGVKLSFSIQTNGTLLDETWAEFFRREGFLVGVSLDGFKDQHNLYRLDAQGGETWNRVVKAAAMLQKHRVEVNALCVVTGQCAKRPERTYRELKKLGFDYLQFIACLDPIGEQRGGQPFSLTPSAYGKFLCQLFDLWYQDWERGQYHSVRLFDDYIHVLLGDNASTCATCGNCGAYFVVEGDGSVYPCDFFALDQWCLGKLGERTLPEMAADERAAAFLQWGKEKPEECAACRWRDVCSGGCKNDWIQTADGSHNYYCKAFRMLLDYAMPRMQRIAQAERMAAVQRMNGYR